MIVLIKKILFKVMSQKGYLKTLHRGFYFLYNLGILKNDERAENQSSAETQARSYKKLTKQNAFSS